MRYTTSAMVCLSLVVIAASTAGAQPQDPTGTWTNRQGGSNYYQGASASDGTYLYIYGGIQDAQANQAYPYAQYQMLRRYDPSGNSWTTLSDPSTGAGMMPYPTLYCAGAYSNGRLFTFGGLYYYFNGSYWTTTQSNIIQAYNISAGTWSVLTSTLSAARYYLTAATCPTASGERIYVIGGTPGTGTNDEFDPSANNGQGAVATRAPVAQNGNPVSLYLHACAAIPSLGKVYVMGGLPTPNANLFEFTPPTSGSPNGSWTSRAPVSNGAGAQQTGYYRAAMSLNGRLYLTGGITSPYTQNFEYNPTTDTWAQRANLNGGRYAHAAVAVGNIGYVYGGYNAYTTLESFTPPDFGSAPFAPTAVAQTGSRPESSMQAKADQTQFDGWTNNQIVFSANVTDPNAGQTVRFRVQIKPEGASWTQANQVISLNTQLGAQGVHTLAWNIPGDGGYDWRWRVEDSYVNSHPPALASVPEGWVEAFGSVEAPNSVSPDFRSDQVPPTDPAGKWPHDFDYQVPDPNFGDVTLEWTESTDNGPVSGISYELQVAREGGFEDIEAQLFSTAGTDHYPITLSVSRYEKFWRMRAKDVGGNLSNWSPALTFRVTYNDGLNHSSGDAKKNCGFTVGMGGPWLVVALFGLTLIAGAARRRFRM